MSKPERAYTRFDSRVFVKGSKGSKVAIYANANNETTVAVSHPELNHGVAIPASFDALRLDELIITLIEARQQQRQDDAIRASFWAKDAPQIPPRIIIKEVT